MIGLVTPPYGLLLFMMNKIADVPLRDMVREVMPFLYCNDRRACRDDARTGHRALVASALGYKG
jgi:hypothetical protein